MNFKRYVEASDTWVDSHYIMGTSTDTLTTLPAVLYPNDTTATVGLKGNTVQNGTPTPDNPIMPQGTGDRTANLFDYKTAYSSYISDNDIVISPSDMISSKNYFTFEEIGETITISAYAKNITSNRVYIAANINGAVYTGQSINAGNQGTISLTVTPTSTNDYFVLSYGSSGTYNTFNNMMIVKGSTVPSEYIPFGYKIPISINNVVTNIYIGDNPLRKSLDGTAYDTLAADGTLTRRVDSDGSVLPTPIITQVTMPTFTTTPGANTLDVLTTVQPSEVTATFNGWHPVSSAHERENGAWT